MFASALFAKLLHIVAMSLMLGATVLNGLIHARAKASHPREAAALTAAVLRINRIVMVPALIAIPLSGAWLAYVQGYEFSELWLWLGSVLAAALIIAFLLGHRIERQLNQIATKAASAPALPAHYTRVFLKAAPIGVAALVLSLTAIFLMIFKP